MQHSIDLSPSPVPPVVAETAVVPATVGVSSHEPEAEEEVILFRCLERMFACCFACET